MGRIRRMKPHTPTIPFKSSYLSRGPLRTWRNDIVKLKNFKNEAVIALVKKRTTWMDEGFPVLCNLQGGGTT